MDGNFRQTRLNDNSYRVGGLKRYRYYGVAIEPELNNMKIRTLDFGVRPSNLWSLNFVLHDYRQVKPFKKIGDIELDVRPSGKDPSLGKKMDVIFALRRFSKVDLNFFVGVFWPGPAFQDAAPRSLFFRQELRYYF